MSRASKVLAKTPSGGGSNWNGNKKNDRVDTNEIGYRRYSYVTLI